jgi:hypothetical protein
LEKTGLRERERRDSILFCMGIGKRRSLLLRAHFFLTEILFLQGLD